MNIDVGQLIKKSRLEKGYTQEELAELVGVKKSAVAKWETGRVSEIKRSNLKKISEALSIDAPLLLGEETVTEQKKPTKLALDELSTEEYDLIMMLRSSSAERRQEALRYVEFLSMSDKQ